MSYEDKRYEAMSLSQLEKVGQELAEKQAAIKGNRRVVAALLDKKVSEDAARHKVNAMSEPERAALLQVLQPEGIEPVEAVNGG